MLWIAGTRSTKRIYLMRTRVDITSSDKKWWICFKKVKFFSAQPQIFNCGNSIAGERIVPDSSSFEPEFVLDDDESQMTLPNKRLHDIRSRASQLSDGSDSDNLQMRRRKQTQKLHYSENDDEEPSTSRRSMLIASIAKNRALFLNFNAGSRSESDQEAGPSTSTGRRGAAQPSVSEYRSAMDSLKRRNMPTQPSAPRNYNQAVSALVPEEEANQEWLEDDIGPNTSKSSNRSSKRRLSSENRSESASRTKKSKRLSFFLNYLISNF